ncbi:MAG: OmpA family protein [Rhodobacteraceae bacterium]|nr:OmpA family protein [Paracoccaceae bacterium]
MIRIALAAALSLAPALGQAQSNDDSGIELFVTDGDAPAPGQVEAEVAVDPLALCMARPGSPVCVGLTPGDAGGDLESTATAEGALQLELVIYDADADTVKSVVVEPDYAADDYVPPADDYVADDGTYAPPPQRDGYAGDVKLPDEYACGDYVAVPTVAISIAFDFGSAKIRWDQRDKIAQIGHALSDRLNYDTPYAVIGHTDAVGSYRYNCDLSWRRATAVVSALQGGWNLPHMIAIGAGEHSLINAQWPDAAENRRVGFLRADHNGQQVIGALSRVCG